MGKVILPASFYSEALSTLKTKAVKVVEQNSINYGFCKAHTSGSGLAMLENDPMKTVILHTYYTYFLYYYSCNDIKVVYYTCFDKYSNASLEPGSRLMLLSGSLSNSNIRNKNILISHKHKLIP